ncbi:MAG: hypothetical protein ACKODX_19670 [Gemmata sp.]
MTRVSAILTLVAVRLLFSPAAASAQYGASAYGYFPPRYQSSPYAYYPSYGYSFSYSGLNVLPSLQALPQLPSLAPLPVLPSLTPYAVTPRYTFLTNSFVNNPYTGATLVTGSYYSGVTPFAWNYQPVYPQVGAYMAGTASSASSGYAAQQHELLRDQRAMALGGQVPNPVAPVGPRAVVDGGPLPDVFATALTPADKAKVVSGEALNDLLKEIVKAEPKGGTRPSAFVPVTLLDDVQFGGAEAAYALNLARRAGSLDFPKAFDDPSLKDLRVVLDRDFSVLATPLQFGKAVDPVKRDRFEQTLKNISAQLPAVSKNLSAEDASAARVFVSHMTNALMAMKAGTATGVIDPKWAVEGTTVADLVKHMTRHKLQFASAPAGNEEAYAALHRNLSNYLFLLTQPRR